MNLQDNVKIRLGKKEDGKQFYSIVDKVTDFEFVQRSVDDLNDKIKNAESCQEDFCEWIRKSGKTILENHYLK